MTLQSLKQDKPKQSKIEFREVRRAKRKQSLKQASDEYKQQQQHWPSTPPIEDEIDLTLDGLYVDDECLREISSESTIQSNTNAQIQAQTMKMPTPTMMNVSSNPIINGAAQTSSYNPLGGSCITSPVPNTMLPQNPYAMYNAYGIDVEYIQEVAKQREERSAMLKRYYTALFMSVKPNDKTEDEWKAEVDKAIKTMFPEPKEVQYKHDHSFNGYTYDENFRREEKSGVSVVVHTIREDENGNRISVKDALVTEPNDPDTGTHTIIYTRSYDIAEYQMQAHFYDSLIAMEMEQQRKLNILRSCSAPPEVINSTFADRAENGYTDPADSWYYKTYQEAKYKRWRKKVECGTLLDPREYGLSFYKSGIDPNVKFDMSTMPTLFDDRNDVKLAYDYQNNPHLFNGEQVTSYLTNKMRINFENRKRAFMEKILSNNLRVDYTPPKDTLPQAPIVGSAPILPDQNGVIMGLDGQPIYDPGRDLVSQLNPNEQSALLEYNINSELARMKQIGEIVDEG